MTILKKIRTVLGNGSTMAVLAVAGLLSVVLGCGGSAITASQAAENTTVQIDLSRQTYTTTTTTTVSASDSSGVIIVSPPTTASETIDGVAPSVGTEYFPNEATYNAITAGAAAGTATRIITRQNPAAGATMGFTIRNASNSNLVAISWTDNRSIGGSSTSSGPTQHQKNLTPQVSSNGSIAVNAVFPGAVAGVGGGSYSLVTSVLITDSRNNSQGFTITGTFSNGKFTIDTPVTDIVYR